jgi:inorganic pyrophosphatase
MNFEEDLESKECCDPALYWKRIMPGPHPPDSVYAIIECPKGTQNKYEMSKNTNLIKLNRVLHSSVIFPEDYGFIPGTLAQDGDPLDIFVLINAPTVPLTLIECKPIGVLIMEDEAGIDNKILAVAHGDPIHQNAENIDEVPPHYLNEIQEFLRTYKNLENPKYSIVKDWKDREYAYSVIEDSINAFKEKYGDIANIIPE